MTNKIPLLDMTDDHVRSVVERALRFGSIKIDELNSVLPRTEMESTSIESLLNWFEARNVAIVE